MGRKRPALFKGRHFEPEIIVLCVRWYLRFSLSFRNLEEIMAERNLSVDHVTIWRWVKRYALELNRRCRRELRNTNRSWPCDETYVALAKYNRANVYTFPVLCEQFANPFGTVLWAFTNGASGHVWDLRDGQSEWSLHSLIIDLVDDPIEYEEI